MPPANPATPTLLRIVQPIALIGSLGAGLLALAILRGSPYDTTMLEQFSSYGVWLLRGLFALAFSSAVTLFLIYRGLARRQPWARPLMVAFSVVPPASSLLLSILGPYADGLSFEDVYTVLYLALVVGYLYFKPNVVAYFKTLRDTQGPGSVA